MNKTPRPNSDLDSLLAGRIEAGDFPSAVYALSQGGEIAFTNALGSAVREPVELKATIDTIYDLASLTKPLITGFLCALMVERRTLKLDSPVARYLPAFDKEDKREITVRHLLTHTSGLPAWRPLYVLTGGERRATLDVIAAEPLVSRPGTHVLYSDLGFITLGVLLETIASTTLVNLAQDEIITPLGLRRTSFLPNIDLRDEVAASETGNAYERGMCTDAGLSSYSKWREAVVWCEVHDGNAHFLGGAAGHAGLFSTAEETSRMAEQFIAAKSRVLSEPTCELFRTNFTTGLEEDRSFAWQLASTRDSTAGSDLPPDSFGHNGFTGTSCWIDAGNQRIYILLTNRTHAHSLPFTNINSIRRRFNSIASSALDSRAKE